MTQVVPRGAATGSPAPTGPSAAPAVDDAPPGPGAQVEGGQGLLVRLLGPAWPLKALLLGFPLWWALGLTVPAYFVAATAMAVQMVRRRRIRVPPAFGVWVMFVAWMLLGVTVLWAHAPGTVDGGGPERLVGYFYRVGWYLACTIGMLYTLNLPERQVPAIKVIRWLGFLFAVGIVGGLAGIVAPGFEFTSPAELIVPGTESGFLQAMFHPSLTTSSDFLGYEQGRPKAPFLYPNSWGNSVGLLLPLFAYSVLRARSRAARIAGGVFLLLAVLPIAYSLNRGLWLGLGVLFVYVLVVLVRAGRHTLVLLAVAALTAGAIVFVATPAGQTVILRINTPHSNERRTTVADVVIRTTWEGSPLLGYGTTRHVTGSFSSLAGSGNADCRQCAAPPLGTQGFLWRLIFTTGFVGTVLFALFMLVQLLAHIRLRDPVSVLGCMMLVLSAVFFIVYDSLEGPLFLLMLVIGLMNRRRTGALAETSAAAGPLPGSLSGSVPGPRAVTA